MIRASSLLAIAALALAGCRQQDYPPLALAHDVDLERFMGDWYVIASIPTRIEREAYDAVESYRLAADGTIELELPKEKWMVSAVLVQSRGPFLASSLMYAINNGVEAMAVSS